MRPMISNTRFRRVKFKANLPCLTAPRLIGVWLALLVFSSGVPAQFDKRRWPPGVTTPALEWTDLSGVQWHRERLKGKVVVINFWATWCAPCLEELPALQTYADLTHGSEVVVLTVNVKDPLSRIQAFVARHGYTLPVVSDRQGTWAKQWGVKVFPTTVLVSPQGQPQWVIEGPLDWTGLEVAQWVRELR